jgi:membrane protein DedA with SNARE-associated domain/uncharacterized tellurite resistance protein B-like protein
MERLVGWLADLSPQTVYLFVGLSTFLENAFPPAPSDFIVALGGFVSQRGGATALLVWLLAWFANMAGAFLVFITARRFGRRFLGSRLGRRLLPADAIVSLERGYLRLGIAGIFVSRFLPGFRVFVAPFVGLVGLPPVPAFLAMGVASGLWYGGLTWVGARLGANWEAIDTLLGHLNRTLAILAGLVAIAVGWWLWRRSQAEGPRRRRLLNVVSRALGEGSTDEGVVSGVDSDLATRGAAALLFELTNADPAFTLEERGAIAEFLRQHWDVGPAPRRSVSTAQPIITDTAEMATIVTEQFDLARRTALAERLFRIAMSDGTLSRHEERLMGRIGDLLGLAAADLAEARARVVR